MATCTGACCTSCATQEKPTATCFTIANDLKNLINETYTLESTLRNLNDTLAFNKTNLAEVVAENAEKNKITTIIDALKSFDSSKIKTTGVVTTCPITADLIKTFEAYRSQLFNTRRYDDDAKRFLDETVNQITEIQSKLDEAKAKIQYMKIAYNREKEILLKQLDETNRLLESCNKHDEGVACDATIAKVADSK